MKRTSIRRIGKRKLRERKELRAFRSAALERAGYACERCGETQNLHAHHRIPRGRGGTNSPENGSCLCQTCHGACHDHVVPDWREWIGSLR